MFVHAVRRVDGIRELDNVWLGEAGHVQALELVLDHLESLLGLQADAELPAKWLAINLRLQPRCLEVLFAGYALNRLTGAALQS